MQQGCCTLPADDRGRVCDRLAGLEQVIDSQTIRQVLLETGRINPRACKLTHEVVLWVVLAMGIFTNMPIRQVFKRSRFARPGGKTPDRTLYAEIGMEKQPCIRKDSGMDQMFPLPKIISMSSPAVMSIVASLFLCVLRVSA